MYVCGTADVDFAMLWRKFYRQSVAIEGRNLIKLLRFLRYFRADGLIFEEKILDNFF